MQRSRVLLGGAVLLVLPAVGLTAAAEDAVAGGQTCHGQPATIVGAPGSEISGTDGADVVVTNGSADIATGAGDDLVCVTAGEGIADVDVTTQAGADVVDTTISNAQRAWVDLGHGDDSFTGGRMPDTVAASNAFETPAGRGSDTVTTGGGDDVVFTGAWFGHPDHDSIDLGAGRDEVWLQGAVDPVLPISGGAGSDRMLFDRISLRHALVIDNGAGEATDAGVPVITWSGFDRFELSAVGPWEAPSFVGGPGPERVWSGLPVRSVALGGGDDVMDLETEGRFADHASYAGGAGDDALLFYSGAGDQVRRERLDLPERRLVVVQEDQLVRARVAGFEMHRLSARRLVVVGTAGADEVRWSGCHGVVDGRGGDDVLRVIDVVDAGCADTDLVTRGGAGDDVLVGNFLRDRLIGGPGKDSADGREDVDRCVAEAEIRCER